MWMLQSNTTRILVYPPSPIDYDSLLTFWPCRVWNFEVFTSSNYGHWNCRMDWRCYTYMPSNINWYVMLAPIPCWQWREGPAYNWISVCSYFLLAEYSALSAYSIGSSFFLVLSLEGRRRVTLGAFSPFMQHHGGMLLISSMCKFFEMHFNSHCSPAPPRGILSLFSHARMCLVILHFSNHSYFFNNIQTIWLYNACTASSVGSWQAIGF